MFRHNGRYVWEGPSERQSRRQSGSEPSAPSFNASTVANYPPSSQQNLHTFSPQQNLYAPPDYHNNHPVIYPSFPSNQPLIPGYISYGNQINLAYVSNVQSQIPWPHAQVSWSGYNTRNYGQPVPFNLLSEQQADQDRPHSLQSSGHHRKKRSTTPQSKPQNHGESSTVQEYQSSRDKAKMMIELGDAKRYKHPPFDVKHQKIIKIDERILWRHPLYSEKKFEYKTLPSTEKLPEGEILGGYIFIANEKTMEKQLRSQIFGLPARYRDSVRNITPGLPLFLYKTDDRKLYGTFKAKDFGKYDEESTALGVEAVSSSDKPKSSYPAQVNICENSEILQLGEEEFRYVLTHYDGPKFCLELSVSQALDLITLFEEYKLPLHKRPGNYWIYYKKYYRYPKRYQFFILQDNNQLQCKGAT